MRLFAETASEIAGTTSKLKKIGFLADYLQTLNDGDLRSACVFFTGRPFPLTDARTATQFNTDANFQKNFNLGGSKQSQIKLEVLNLFNRPTVRTMSS